MGNHYQLSACVYYKPCSVHSVMVFQPALPGIGAISCYFKQSAQISTGTAFYCMAGHGHDNECGGGHFRGSLWLNLQHIISFYTGFRQCDPEKITLIYTLGGNKRDVFRKVVLPGCLPTLLSTSKVNIGLALVGVIIGEFLAARRGLGYLIIYGSQVFQLNLVITSVIILCVIAFGFYKAIQGVEYRLKRQIGG